MVTGKEKREMVLILGSVFLVALMGVAATLLASEKINAIAGASAQLNLDIPTYPGALILLKEYCSPQVGAGSCDEICGEKICLPADENCDTALEQNQCLCCEVK